MGKQVFGDNFVFWVLQLATAGILTLAANTAFADFPRLSSIIARDGYLPRQLANRGDRLVFSNGVLILATFAGVLLVAFQGKTNKLIPLYAVGVFVSFTLSQAGMVHHHQKEREPGWKRNSVDQWCRRGRDRDRRVDHCDDQVLGRRMDRDHRHPDHRDDVQGDQDAITTTWPRVYASLPEYKPRRMNHTVVVLVGTVHRGVLEALAYAKSLAPNHLVAMTIVSDEDEQERIEQQWLERNIDVPLEIVHSPYRELVRPVLRFVDELDARYENDIITVVIPEFVVSTWWGHLLHNQSALVLKGRLLFRKGTVVTSVPYHVD